MAGETLHHVFHSMGIPVHITAVGLDADSFGSACQRASAAFREWDARFSRFKPESELARINSELCSGGPAGSSLEIAISPEMSAVLRRCVDLAAETDGAFDPCIGAYLAAAGYGLPEAYVLPQRVSTYRDLAVGTLSLSAPLGTVLEPAAIVKGMAIDAAAAALCDGLGRFGFMINAGGDLLTGGDYSAPQLHWNVGIQNPRDRQRTVTAISVHGAAVATSGTYEVRRSLPTGREWHHEIDARTGEPADGVSSLTVVAPTAQRADELASIGFLFGVERGSAYLESGGVPYLYIDVHGRMFRNKKFAELELNH